MPYRSADSNAPTHTGPTTSWEYFKAKHPDLVNVLASAATTAYGAAVLFGCALGAFIVCWAGGFLAHAVITGLGGELAGWRGGPAEVAFLGLVSMLATAFAVGACHAIGRAVVDD